MSIPPQNFTMQTIATTPPPQEVIDRLALNFAKRRQQLADVVGAYDAEILAVHNRYRAKLTEAAGNVAGAETALRAEIEKNRELFTEPKSWTCHGIQLGVRKGSGKLEWDDDDVVVALIEKHFEEDEAELLIRTKRTPIVAALEDLDAKTLAKLGVTVEDTGDVVFVRPLVKDVDKLLKALVKEAGRADPKPAKAKKGGTKK